MIVYDLVESDSGRDDIGLVTFLCKYLFLGGRWVFTSI